jgi:hypothetical protein
VPVNGDGSGLVLAMKEMPDGRLFDVFDICDSEPYILPVQGIDIALSSS